MLVGSNGGWFFFPFYMFPSTWLCIYICLFEGVRHGPKIWHDGESSKFMIFMQVCGSWWRCGFQDFDVYSVSLLLGFHSLSGARERDVQRDEIRSQSYLPEWDSSGAQVEKRGASSAKPKRAVKNVIWTAVFFSPSPQIGGAEWHKWLSAAWRGIKG